MSKTTSYYATCYIGFWRFYFLGTAAAQSVASAGRNLSQVNSLHISASQQAHTDILLATAWATVGVTSGRAVSVRVLLDQGSEITFITENLVQLLRAKRIRMPVSISVVGYVDAGTFRYATQITISPRNTYSPSLSVIAVILKNLTSYAQKRVADLSSLSHLTDLQWADSAPFSSEPIDLILGANIYNDIILDGLRKGTVGQPVAQNTIFGWVISGPLSSARVCSRPPSSGFANSQSAVNVSVHHCFNSPSLEDAIRKFWEIEEIPRKSILSADDEKCEEHFHLMHTRSPDGRYTVRLPFRKNPPIDIGKSRLRAEKSLESLTRRLRSHPEHSKEYREFLKEYERLGHMCQVSRESDVSDGTARLYSAPSGFSCR